MKTRIPPLQPFIQKFIQLESSGGIVLFIMAVLALVVDNSPLRDYYHRFFDATFAIHLGPYNLSKPILLWINDGFMAIFFLLVGLEIKRELIDGELNSFSKAVLPGIAAFGGMAVPALFYVAFNWGDSNALAGWAIPTATDIAFSLGILALLGSRIPATLKIFLMALAIFDDIGAIAIIAVFYTNEISLTALSSAFILLGALFLMNRLKVTKRWPYIIVGLILWICVLKSGVHATLAGIALAFAIPLRDDENPDYLPAQTIEHALHPWVTFAILPLFAFANAGVSFQNLSLQHFVGPVSMGIMTGLFFGKQLGIWGATLLAIRLGIGKMPKGVSGLAVYGVSLIAGVGFTMSLFIGTLAFEFSAQKFLYADLVRTGVLTGSLLSGLLGYFILRLAYQKAVEKHDTL